MAIHPSILAWRIPWTKELGGLQPIGSHRVRYSCSDLACMHAILLRKVQLCICTHYTIISWSSLDLMKLIQRPSNVLRTLLLKITKYNVYHQI